MPDASVVIRSKDEADSIGRTLRLLAAQTLAPRAEVIVVDSGSRDDTVAIARASGAQVIEIPAASFTFGGALNTGTERARSDVTVALSAHAFPGDPTWLERMVQALADERVACACGCSTGPDREPLAERVVQDFELARTTPYWGYSNVAGGFRTALWRERPFREDMPGTEDKEWAWHWMQRGYVVVMDPALGVDHSHHDDDGFLSRYERWRREWLGFGMYLELEPYRVRDVARDWWRNLDGRRSRARARLSPKRAGELAGAWKGRRDAAERA